MWLRSNIACITNIHGLYGCSCNLLDVISVYSLNPGKLPGRFSYEWPGYEAKLTPAINLLVSLVPRARPAFRRLQYGKVVEGLEDFIM